MIVPAVDTIELAERIATPCTQTPSVFAAYGLHPMFLATSCTRRCGRTVCVAGTAPCGGRRRDRPGLFHRRPGSATLQRSYFARQLRSGRERGLPVIVHARGALGAGRRSPCAAQGPARRGPQLLRQRAAGRQLWDIGFHLGIGGPVTYAARTATATHRRADADRVPAAGKRCARPARRGSSRRAQRAGTGRGQSCRCVAALRGESEDTIAAATTANARRLFGLPSN